MDISIKSLCQQANVSRSGYYSWLKNVNKQDKDFDDYKKINSIFKKRKEKSGWRVIKMELESIGIIMNHKKIRRIMKKYKLFTKIRKRNPYRYLTKATKEHKIKNNILKREFNQNKPLKVLLTDITYVYYGNGEPAYLGAVKDAATREIVSFHVSKNLSMDLGVKPINDIGSLYSKEDLNGCIIHSDQGIHYTSSNFSYACQQLNLIQSMSRKGNCLDNAPMESFFGHFKDEVDYKSCKTFEELKLKISEYMDYYNNERKQWTLKKMTPVEYRTHLLAS